MADRIGRFPVEPGDRALEQPRARAKADALDLHAIEIGAHVLRAARFPEQEIVGGIVALRDRAVEKIAERRRETAIQHHRPDRLMEEGEVVAAHGHRRLQAELALVRLGQRRSEEHTSELQSLMRISYAVFCLKNKKKHTPQAPLPTYETD